MTVLPLRVAYIELDPETDLNSAIFRLHLPAKALNKGGYKATVVKEHEWMSEQLAASVVCADADLIVMQRPWRIEHVDMMKKWLLRKKPVFIDIDDAYDRLDPGNIAYTFWNTVIEGRNGKGLRRLDMLRDSMRTATGVTVAARRLESDWRSQGIQNVGYFPNYLDIGNYTDIAQKPAPLPGEKITLGFGGSTSHIKGWKDSGLMTALRRMTKARQDFRVNLHTPDERLAVTLAVDLGTRLSWYKWMRVDLWPKAMAEFDIALAPVSGIVDQRRSHLRVAEAMSLGVPWIANAGGPYDEFASDGALIDQGARKWEQAITEAFQELEALKEKAARRRASALAEFDVNTKADEIAHGYQEMMG